MGKTETSLCGSCENSINSRRCTAKGTPIRPGMGNNCEYFCLRQVGDGLQGGTIFGLVPEPLRTGIYRRTGAGAGPVRSGGIFSGGGGRQKSYDGGNDH